MKDDRQRRGYSDANGRLPPISLKIGSIMLQERGKKHWGWEIAKRVGTTPGTVSQIFQSFATRGWVDCQHEMFNADNAKPPRVLYSLTASGVVAIRDALIPFQHAPVST
jgi:hypothetical protein